MNIEYRPFRKSDFVTVAEIADDERKENHLNIARAMAKTSGSIERCLLAFDQDILVGYIYGFALPNNTLIPEFLYVKPAYRNRGIATTLLSKLEADAGCTISMVFYNRGLHGFYSGVGYHAGENLEVAIKEIHSRKA